ECTTNATVAIGGMDTGHMRMKTRRAIAKPCHGKRKTDQTTNVEGPSNLPASVGSNYKHGGGLDFQILLAPNIALQGYASIKVVQRYTLAHADFFAHARVVALPALPRGVRSRSDSFA